MSRELLRQALDALKYHRDQTRPIHLTQLAIHAIEDRLAQQDAEPVDTTVIGARLFGATTRLMAALHMERIGEDLLDKAEPSMASVLQDAAENLHEQSAAAWGECISALEAWSNVATSPQQAQPAHAVPTDLMLAASAASAAWKSYWQGGRAHSAAVDFAQAMNALDEAIAAQPVSAPAEVAPPGWRDALQFYADGNHFNISGDPSAWDTTSGEPTNFWCDEAGTATMEDGTVAKMALAGTPLPNEDDEERRLLVSATAVRELDSSLMQAVESILEDGHMNQEHLARLRAAWEGATTPAMREPLPVSARPASEYHEDHGAVLWWTFPINEPPYCGQPSDDDWPAYHTHWTPLVLPGEPGSAHG